MCLGTFGDNDGRDAPYSAIRNRPYSPRLSQLRQNNQSLTTFLETTKDSEHLFSLHSVRRSLCCFHSGSSDTMKKKKESNCRSSFIVFANEEPGVHINLGRFFPSTTHQYSRIADVTDSVSSRSPTAPVTLEGECEYGKLV